MTFERNKSVFISGVDQNCDFDITQKTQLHGFLDETLSSLAQSDSPGPVGVDLLVLLDLAFAHFKS